MALVLLLVALVVLDRGAARLAEGAVASELRSAAGLPSPPAVEVRGFPFLTQAVRGRYDEVVLRAAGVPAGGTTVTELHATVRGLQVPLRAVLAREVSAAPADHVQARALVSYAELSRASGDRQLAVDHGGAPDVVRVTGSVRALGQSVSVAALSTVALEGDEVVVTAQSFDVGSAAADRVLSRALGDRLDLRIRVQRLPYGLELTGLRTTPAGVELTAAATDVVLSAP
jgi:hypothetical protein